MLHIGLMGTDVFAVVAEPRRRDILEQLRSGPASVNDLVTRLELSQPMVSKHLKVLRDTGFVTSRPSAQQRIYHLNHEPLQELESWLLPYREQWQRSFGALHAHLDRPTPTQKDS